MTGERGSGPRRALPAEREPRPRRGRAVAAVTTVALLSLPLVAAVPLPQPLTAVPAPRPPVVEPDVPDARDVGRPDRVVEPDRTGRTLPGPDVASSPTPGPGPSPGTAPSGASTLDPEVPASPERDPATLPDPSTEVTDLDLPAAALRAYREAAEVLGRTDPGCRVDWALLAGIGRVESDHGRHGGAVVGVDGSTSPRIIGVPLDGSAGVAAIRDTDGGRLDGDPVWDRAVGPMQFIPSTWAGIAADGDGDGVSDPHDLDDAALGAARYLCPGPGDLSTRAGAEAAVLRYNRSVEYVALVLGIADAYRSGDVDLPVVPPHPSAGDRDPDPSGTPSPDPSGSPSPGPSGSPSPDPSKDPDPDPTESPDPNPTETPDPDPSETPDPDPSETPDPDPTGTPDPTESPDPDPTESPDPDPTESPDPDPTESPDPDPSESPDPQPSESPDPEPTETPDPEPTSTPDPSESPSPDPTETPGDPDPTETPNPEPTHPPDPDPSRTPDPTPDPSGTATPGRTKTLSPHPPG